jgi:hypothetical protein
MTRTDHTRDASATSVPALRVAAISTCHPRIESRKRAADIVNTESEPWHDELTLLSDLATAQRQISAYVLRALDADAKRDEPTAPSDEHALGTRLVDLGSKLQARANRRAGNAREHVEKKHPTRDTARDRPRETATPWINHTTAIYLP